jgi:hypothetical protein
MTEEYEPLHFQVQKMVGDRQSIRKMLEATEITLMKCDNTHKFIFKLDLKEVTSNSGNETK